MVGIPFWWLKTNGTILVGIGEFTTHLRVPILGIAGGTIWILTHGQILFVLKGFPGLFSLSSQLPTLCFFSSRWFSVQSQLPNYPSCFAETTPPGAAAAFRHTGFFLRVSGHPPLLRTRETLLWVGMLSIVACSAAETA